MNHQTRISKLEVAASSLPPDGRVILARLKKMTVEESEAAVREMTDDELFAAVMTDIDRGGLDVTKLTDDELKRIANGEEPAEVLKGRLL